MTPLPALLARLAQRWSWRSMPWLGGLFIALITALAFYDVVRDYRSTVAATGRELDAHARLLAEQTARSVQAVDLMLRHVAEQVASGARARDSQAELHAWLQDQSVGLVQVEGLTLSDARGDLLATSVRYPLPVPMPNVAHFSAFQLLRDHPATGLAIDPARESQVKAGLWIFPIVRRIEGLSGQFIGTVAAGGRIDYFEQFYRDVRLDEGTRIALIHRSGTLMARHPPAPEALGRRMPLFDSLVAVRQRGTEGPSRTTSPVDGIDTFGAVETVAGLPLAVIVTRDAEVALAPWREQALGTAGRTLALSVLAVLLMALLQRQFVRNERARQALEMSRERFALAAAGSDDGIWDWDVAGDRVYGSARAQALFGLRPVDGVEELSREAWFEGVQIHPDDAEPRRAALRAHLDGHTPHYEAEYRVRHDDGSYRWVRARGLCVRNADGEPQRMAGSVTDIDARRRAEDGLRLSEQRFALAVAGSNDGIIDWDIEGDSMYTSERTLEMVGANTQQTQHTRAEWLALLRLHPDEQERHTEELNAFLAGPGTLREGEFRVQRADGAYRWVRLRNLCIRAADGRPLRLAGSVSDIDAYKRSEEALRRSEERYQLAVEGSNEGLWDWDLSSDSLFLSPRAQEILWLEPGEVQRPRREWIALTAYHPDDEPVVRASIAAHLRGRTRHFKVEYRLRHHSGEWRWYRQRGVAVRDASGRPTRMAGSMEDITDRKNSEAEREHLGTQLRQAQKLEAIGTLAGGIAHDFNNILAAILGYGEMAQKSAAEGSKQRRYIDAALSAGMRAKSLVERILAFSRSGMGERRPVHAQSVVVEALDLFEASLPPGVTLQRRLEAGDAAVLGDPTQVHQVVMNLCANAAQAMRGGGKLTVALDCAELQSPRCATSVLASGTYIRLTVHDTGGGIAPGVLDRIFDPFFTTKEVGVGTGLGLSLVHGIVTDLGGGIGVESRVDEGSTFTVYLPWQSATAAAIRIEEDAPLGGGETVLLVDDEETLVRLGEEMIAGLGYEPVGFTSSVAALEALRRAPQRFDIVLSDEAMPEMTGSELAREVRAIRADIPIVLMSGYVSTALIQRAREAGVAEVLAKPLVERDIARCLVGALRP